MNVKHFLIHVISGPTMVKFLPLTLKIIIFIKLFHIFGENTDIKQTRFIMQPGIFLQNVRIQYDRRSCLFNSKEFPIGSYVKLSLPAAVIAVGGLGGLTQFG